MLMEEIEIPGGDDESVTEEDVLLIIPSDLPYPDDFLLDPEDTRYLKIFLDKGPIMVRPLGLFFPCACERIFRASIEYSRLRQAIVALSMDFVDSPPVLSPRLSRYLLPFHTKPGDPSKRTTAYARDSEVFAIFLIITLTLKHLSTTKDVPSLRRHVRHLYKLFRSAQADVTRGKRDPLSPLLFYIWRQIMRINVTLALGVTHIPSCFPPPALHPNGKIATGYGPVGELLGSAPREFEQWTLAQLELDDIGNRISRMHLRANAVRSGKQSDEVDERELVLNTELLVRLNDRWRQNPVIQVAEYLEQLHRQTPPDADSKEKHFLSYPELRFRNPLYACLLLAHYAIRISSSFVLDQRIGPQTPDRLEAAIEICRIYAALGGNHPVGSLTCLASIWWAGLVFDETTHPNGMHFYLGKVNSRGEVGPRTTGGSYPLWTGFEVSGTFECGVEKNTEVEVVGGLG